MFGKKGKNDEEEKKADPFGSIPGRDWNRSEMAGFGALISAMSGGGDRGNAFPQSDADDFASGARFIPGEVTLARRRGEKVQFEQNCGNPNCWNWRMPNGQQIYHFDQFAYQQTADANGQLDENGKVKDGGAGPCPRCGNEHTSGGTF